MYSVLVLLPYPCAKHNYSVQGVVTYIHVHIMRMCLTCTLQFVTMIKMNTLDKVGMAKLYCRHIGPISLKYAGENTAIRTFVTNGSSKQSIDIQHMYTVHADNCEYLQNVRKREEQFLTF